MQFYIEKYISNFIENQFPVFYKEHGEVFILFVKAYYEWSESNYSLKDTSNNVILSDYDTSLKPPIHQSRNILDYKDIDNTLEEFLEFFQKKYLYGIPFNVIINKRLLLKHILSVYRSKGTLQCYKLLFRLIYNEDVDIYLPSQDMLRVSDGKWNKPKYLEVTSNVLLDDYVGKVIQGSSSKTLAVVENFIQETYNKNIINTLYISNILPAGGTFVIGEKIILEGQTTNTAAVATAPVVLGSLDKINIINGGQDFNIGDIIKIAQKDPITDDFISFGVDGTLKVDKVKKGFGQLNFDISDGGFGYFTNADCFVYPNANDNPSSEASFNIFAISDTIRIEYNTDLICDFANTLLNANSFGFSGNVSANLTSNIQGTLSYSNNLFGTIASLTNINTGNGYNYPANVFVRTLTRSDNPLSGNISYNTTSNTVTGTGTDFTNIFSNNDVLILKANSFLNSSEEKIIIKSVTNATSLILYAPPSKNSTASAEYYAAPIILRSNFAIYDPIMSRIDNTINGQNEIITAYPSVGNNVIYSVTGVNSGKAYIEGEEVIAYLSGALSNPIIKTPGLNYTNNDVLVFVGGGGSVSVAEGFVTTNSSGAITSVTLTYAGSGYTSSPKIVVRSATGSGAEFLVSITEFNTFSQVRGRVVKKGIGEGIGRWETTDGFLNSDKYIQDSYYYQDYSYEVRVAATLDKYKNILYETFHTAGSELFGKFVLNSIENSLFTVPVELTETPNNWTCDTVNISCDNVDVNLAMI